MKTTFFRSWKMVFILAAAPLLVAGMQTLSMRGAARVEVATAEPASTFRPGPDLAPTTTAAVIAEPAMAPTGPEAGIPAISPGTAQIIKLAESGSDEALLQAFVRSSTNRFNLDSDAIVYLNDLGISGAVIKDMIEHDAALSAAVRTEPMPAMTNAITAAYAPVVEAMPQPVPAGPDYAPNYTDYDTGDYSNPEVGADYFYGSLAPYGTWIDVGGYGRCWQPTVGVVNPAWRPYCDRGRWVDTDCGWYWQSDYSWGWAAFHYGRWFEDDHRGWVWRPDRAWGPAWVSWRYSSDVCGWAPLPPGAHFRPGIGWQFGNRSVGVNFEFGLKAGQYTFVPTSRFGDHDLTRSRLPAAQLGRVFNQTAVHNRSTFEDDHIFNHGIDPKRVADASHTEIRKAVIRDLPAGGGVPARVDRIQKSGGTAVVFRPQLPPPGVKIDDQHGTPPQRGSTGVPVVTATPTLLTSPQSGALRPIPAQTLRPGASQERKDSPSADITMDDLISRGARPKSALVAPATQPGNQPVTDPTRNGRANWPSNARSSGTAATPGIQPAAPTLSGRPNPPAFNRPVPDSQPQPGRRDRTPETTPVQPDTGGSYEFSGRANSPAVPAQNPAALPTRIAPEMTGYRSQTPGPAYATSSGAPSAGRMPPAYSPPPADASAFNSPAPRYSAPAAPALPAYHAPVIESRPAPAPAPAAAPAASANQASSPGASSGRR
jgi:hypothetical protein